MPALYSKKTKFSLQQLHWPQHLLYPANIKQSNVLAKNSSNKDYLKFFDCILDHQI